MKDEHCGATGDLCGAISILCCGSDERLSEMPVVHETPARVGWVAKRCEDSAVL